MNATEILGRLIASTTPVLELDEFEYVNNLALECLRTQTIPPGYENEVITILKICNLVYNNASNATPILPDEVYDKLIVLCKRNNLQIPIGAPPKNFDEVSISSKSDDNIYERDDKGFLIVAKKVPNKEKMFFFNQLSSNYTIPNIMDFYHPNPDTITISNSVKRVREVSHKYDLCGTLDKCKYTLDIDAKGAGDYQDPSVMIFERDFLAKHCAAGIVNPNDIEVICSLKYDGFSIEQSVDGYTVVDAVTRGDTSLDVATDMTPVLGGFEYTRAKEAGIVPNGEPFGMKVEYIITYRDLVELNNLMGKNYANPRNAVAGISGRKDAKKWISYTTPVPLETSMDIDRVEELEFLNRYYTKGVDIRYAVIRGNYAEVLYQIKQFVLEAEALRPFMGFAYDGIVVEYRDKRIRKILGKNGAIPRYAIAIKFEPMKAISTFVKYEYSVGQDGVITPIAYFLPVEFFGCIHDHASAHSYDRFKALSLREGDKVELTYRNDVMVYINRAPECAQDPNNHNPVIEFPTVCPSCGSQLYVSDSGSSVYCVNIACPERNIMRFTNALAKLGLKGFSEETVRALGVIRFRDLYNYDHKKMDSILGPNNGPTLRQSLIELQNANLPDYRIIGSLGFTNIAIKTWKTILEQFDFGRLITCNDDDLYYLTSIKGIGLTTVETIVKERPYFMDDLKFIFGNFKYHKSEYEAVQRPKVIFTGTRDEDIIEGLISIGYDVEPDGSYTNSINMLIVPYEGWNSSKVSKAFKFLAKQYKKDHPEVDNIQVNWDNYLLFASYTPYIVTADQARLFIEKGKGN